MLIEECAYANRWRTVSPVAKGVVSLCGVVAAYAATTPPRALGVAALLSAATVMGAGVPLSRYIRVAAPALLFLLASTFSLALSVKIGSGIGDLSLQFAKTELPRIAQVCSRSLAGLSALLFLSMTTPLTDLMAMLRRLKAPEVLLDIMILCYRTLFIFTEAVRETMTAQSARLGYASARLSLRSLGGLVANLSIQIWQRSHALHVAAMARNSDGPLRFLEANYCNFSRNVSLALCGGTALITLALVPS